MFQEGAMVRQGQMLYQYNIGVGGRTLQTMYQTAPINLNPLYSTSSPVNAGR